MSNADLDAVLARIDADIEQSLARLADLVAIPSISTDPAYAGDITRAAESLAADLRSIGFDAAVRPTPGHPIVVGHDRSADGPGVLFYGHYDVQPVDPLALWHSDPFAMQRVPQPDGSTHLVGRGTSDDKGQLMTFIEACRAWRAVTGSLPLKVSILLEGEEESGGKSLPGFLAENADELRTDIGLICDTDMWSTTTPSINTMLRGLVGEEVEITCADKDLHSGMFGSAARNPIQVLATIIASLRNPDGSVAVAGFYDGVPELPPAQAEQWRNLGFDDKGFLGSAGLTTPAGEKDRSVLEQIWSRPTCEINGIIGGYTGEGFKTVIPAKASAKISFRLVGTQDPDTVRAAFRAHVRDRLPPDCTVTFREHGGSPAVSVPVDGVFMRKAAEALADEWGNPTVLTASGGSIPVAGDFKRQLGMDALLIGFAHHDDRIHSPNEKYDLASFHGGIRSWARILAGFAE